MPSGPPIDFFCPVCGEEVDRLWVWTEPGSADERARIYCMSCGLRPPYQNLPIEQRRHIDRAAFDRWAGGRTLRRVFQKEHRA
jgi:hypothetical protein